SDSVTFYYVSQTTIKGSGISTTRKSAVARPANTFGTTLASMMSPTMLTTKKAISAIQKLGAHLLYQFTTPSERRKPRHPFLHDNLGHHHPSIKDPEPRNHKVAENRPNSPSDWAHQRCTSP